MSASILNNRRTRRRPHTFLSAALFAALLAAVSPVDLVLAAVTVKNTRPDFEAPLTTTIDLARGVGRATFSRADGADRRATVTDFEGLVRPVKSGEARFEGARRVENLVSYTEDFSNGYWGKGAGVTVTSNAGTAPDGFSTAERVQSGSTNYALVKDIIFSGSPANRSFRVSVWVKSNTGSSQTFRIALSSSFIADYWTGDLTATTGWQRFSFLKAFGGSDTGDLDTTIVGRDSGGGAFDLLVWGAEVEEVTGQTNQNPSEYVSTGVKTAAPYHGANVDGVKYFDYQNGNTVASNVVTEARGAAIADSTLKGYLAEGSRTNLVLRSEEFDNASWTKTNESITTNIVTAPNGQSVADKIVETSGGPFTHKIEQSVSKSASAVSYTFSVYAKATGRDDFMIRLSNADVSNRGYAFVHLDTSSIDNITANGFSNVSATISSASNGFQKVTLTATTDTDVVVIPSIMLLDSSNNTSYTGDGSSGLYLWGAQLEQASFASSYIPTTSASVTRGNDDLTYPIANISNSAGATYAEVTATGSTTSRIISTAGAAGFGQLYFGTSPSIYTAAMYDGANSAVSGVSGAMNAVQKMASKWSGASMKAFQNGTAGSAGIYDGAFDTSGNNIALLITSNGANPTFGTIKNVKIWKQAMSDTFLQNLTAGQAGVEKKATGKVANDLGLVGYWSFEDGSGTKATDFSGQGNTGTLTNMEAGDWTDGRLGKGLQFDGVNEYVSAGTSGLSATVGSVSVWFRHDAVNPSATEMFFAQRSTVSGANRIYMSVLQNSNDFSVAIGDQNNIDTTVDAAIGTWNHAVLTWNNGSYQVFFNGAQVKSGTYTAFSGVGPCITIGAWNNSSCTSGGNHWNGSIDEVRIYNRALSQDEITKLYQTGAAKINVSQNTKGPQSGLVGLWSFNGPDVSGTTASDRSGSGNNGTLTNGPLVRPGKVGQALSFDGGNDYVSVAATPSGMTQFSFSVWTKVPALQGASSFSRVVDLGTRRGALYINAGGKNVVAFASVVGQGDLQTSPFSMTLGQWHHLVGVFDYVGNTIKLYADGNLIGSPAVITGTQQAGTDFYIGSEDGTQYFMDGSIDEVRIYNRALSVDEVKQLYNLGR